MAKTDEIRCFVVGDLQTNCYAYVCGGECLVVDPGASGAKIAEALSDVRVTRIVATHRHLDHVGGIRALVEATGAPWYIGQLDAEGATHAVQISSHMFEETPDVTNPPAADGVLCEGDVVELGTARFKVIETPGHTPGGIVLLGEGTAEGVAFVGDTLFAGSCGRTDLMGGNWEQMSATLERLTQVIPSQVTLLSGHGPATTMERELRTNPYLQPGAWRPSHEGA